MRSVLGILLAALLVGLAGCAKDSGGNSATSTCDRCVLTGALPPTGTGTNPTQTGYTGSTVNMTSYSGLQSFFYQSYPRSPTNVRINMDFSPGRAADTVIVSYIDGYTGRYVEAGMGTVHPDSGFQSAIYNGWVKDGSNWVWKGFFQDRFGAIIVIINRTTSPGDGQPAQFVGGDVYFQNFEAENFPYAPYQGPEKMCWEIQMGPYDCRSFLIPYKDRGWVVMNSSSVPNTKGPDKPKYYQLLGTFDGIDANAAGVPVAPTY